MFEDAHLLALNKPAGLLTSAELDDVIAYLDSLRGAQ